MEEVKNLAQCPVCNVYIFRKYICLLGSKQCLSHNRMAGTAFFVYGKGWESFSPPPCWKITSRVQGLRGEEKGAVHWGSLQQEITAGKNILITTQTLPRIVGIPATDKNLVRLYTTSFWSRARK